MLRKTLTRFDAHRMEGHFAPTAGHFVDIFHCFIVFRRFEPSFIYFFGFVFESFSAIIYFCFIYLDLFSLF